jgi:hypothetical protein
MTTLPVSLPLIEAIPDTELDRMVERAWRDASRNWQEARSCSSSIAAVMRRVARESEAFWSSLRVEQARRLTAA